MIRNVRQETVEVVRERERERERERVILTKLYFINHVQKSSVVDKLKRNKYIEKREIGYVDIRKMCYV